MFPLWLFVEHVMSFSGFSIIFTRQMFFILNRIERGKDSCLGYVELSHVAIFTYGRNIRGEVVEKRVMKR